jgi:hypothetical protein
LFTNLLFFFQIFLIGAVIHQTGKFGTVGDLQLHQRDARRPHTIQGPADGPAEIERVCPDFDPKTRKINLELALGRGVPEMRGGLRTKLILEIPDKSGAVLVPEEALAGATQHAASALGMGDTHGSLEVGKVADFVAWQIDRPADLAYWLGGELDKRVVRHGVDANI